MADENAVLEKEKIETEEAEETFDFDALEEKLQGQLENELADLQVLTDEKEKIGSPDELGKVIGNVVWEQFLNQIAVTAGEDFIEANRGLTLDLRTEAHVQSVDNFEQQKYATHNTYVDYKAREKNTGRIFIQTRIISQPLSRNRNSGTMKKRKYGKPMILLMENGRKR